MARKEPRWIAEDRGFVTECWIWQLKNTVNGYGRERVGGRNGPQILAHRRAYEEVYGPIPEGLHLDHLCRVRLCVRPDHLEPVTQAENNIRSAKITPAMADEILASTERQVDLAARYGVAQASISRVKRKALLWQRLQETRASHSHQEQP